MIKFSRRFVPVLACAAGLVAVAAPTASAYDGNPLDGTEGFGVFIHHDALLGSTESEGPVAVGGNLSFGAGYNVALNTAGSYTADGDARPTGLLVGGRVDFPGSDPTGVLKVLGDGYVKIGDPTGAGVLTTDANGAAVATHVVAAGSGYDSTPRIELSARQPAAAVTRGSLPDFDARFTAFRTRATAMAACAENVQLLDGNGNPYPDQNDLPPGAQVKIHLTADRTNVLRLTGTQLNRIGQLTFLDQPTTAAPLVIVVDTNATGHALAWNSPTFAGLDPAGISALLWDFPDATSITHASGDTINGTLYAPSARLTDLDASNIQGDIVVESLVHGSRTNTGPSGGEMHYFPFTAHVSCDGESSTPSPSPSPTPSATPSPNNGPGPSTSPSRSTPSSPSTTANPSTPATPGASPRQPAGPSPAPGEQLAQTGADTGTRWIAAAGLLTTAAGALALRASRRRRH
ncbi:choice-of-anchor A family protein [Kitasatospora sp. SolWspMP-SS2h]|uniref:choice-of-anchor A family protein n=1 Tax=Kitasatospora sp. SolWspMP-SS2h TaxID=1305729 RepID=UPI001314D2E5|nr:choice-of-anchor A family protein [Kitasatospora sp. SolWspMP-SS2h]